MRKTNKKTEGLQLVARFALPPNSMGYCGRDSAPEKFKKCFIHGECVDIEEEVTKFIVLNPYLQTISKVTGLPFCSKKVVECYWLGNDLIHEFKIEHYNLLLDEFLKQGVPTWFVEELREKQPKKFIPTHLFQVMHVGVGKASGTVPFNLESINSCMIRWGQVLSISSNTFTALTKYITQKSDGNYFISQVEETFEYVSDFLPNLSVGDIVAVHWKQPVKILTNAEVENLVKWTNNVLQVIQ
ncbi:MAG: DUF6390 family protein [Patescibacteria group bacterium]